MLGPSTGYPAASDLAPSVVGADGAQCDALSTACFVRGSTAPSTCGARPRRTAMRRSTCADRLRRSHVRHRRHRRCVHSGRRNQRPGGASKRRASKAELLFAAVVVAVAVGGFAVAHAAGAPTRAAMPSLPSPATAPRSRPSTSMP
ncbi:MAG: FAD:protein FMN transferase [Eggerthellaceae bacterium]